MQVEVGADRECNYALSSAAAALPVSVLRLRLITIRSFPELNPQCRPPEGCSWLVRAATRPPLRSRGPTKPELEDLCNESIDENSASADAREGSDGARSLRACVGRSRREHHRHGPLLPAGCDPPKAARQSLPFSRLIDRALCSHHQKQSTARVHGCGNGGIRGKLQRLASLLPGATAAPPVAPLMCAAEGARSNSHCHWV